MKAKLNQKTINNAISAYFFLGALLLLNRTNPYINNDFVRGHSKTAMFLHISIIIIFFFLGFFSFLGNYPIFQFNLLYIIKTILIFCVFTAIAYGAIKAYKGESFNIEDLSKITKINALLSIEKSKVTREQDKTSIILSYIPFVGYLLYPSLEKYASIQSVNKINLYSSLSIIFFYASGKYNIASLLALSYIIYVVFTAFKLYMQNEISIVNLKRIWSFQELYIRSKAFALYLFNYSHRDHRFREYELYLKIEKAAVTKQAKLILKDLLPRKSLPFKKWLLYIPFVNLIGVFFLDTKYKTHIINGICVDIVLLAIWIIFGFNNAYSLFIFFPISYGIAYQRKIDYRFPLIYDIVKIEMTAWTKAKEVVAEVQRKRKEDIETVFSVKKRQNTKI